MLRESRFGTLERQVQVAERTGIAQNRLSRYGNGRQLPDVPALNRLQTSYGADLERLGRAIKEVGASWSPEIRESIPRSWPR